MTRILFLIAAALIIYPAWAQSTDHAAEELYEKLIGDRTIREHLVVDVCEPRVFTVHSTSDSDVQVSDPRLEELILVFRSTLISALSARYSTNELQNIVNTAVEEKSVDEEFQSWVGTAIGDALMTARLRSDECGDQEH